MATSTDMKGNVVKMEVDYSETVDKRIPECEALAAVCNSRFLLALLLWQYYFNSTRVGLFKFTVKTLSYELGFC